MIEPEFFSFTPDKDNSLNKSFQGSQLLLTLTKEIEKLD